MDRISTQIIQAIDATGRIVEGVQDHQWSQPTPCPEWDCRELTNPLVGGMRLFAAAIVEGGVDSFRVPGVFGPAAPVDRRRPHTAGCWPFSVDAVEALSILAV